uniref:Probable polygalacturonase At3g15720 n=1 Tax=Elaeis guineensis var. tenera TaxID=51953 RepID=A0A6J0PD66_ELAGV
MDNGFMVSLTIQAFMHAWDAACVGAHSDDDAPTFLVPEGKTFLLSAVSFEGPCSYPIHIQIDGTILAPNETWTLEEDIWIIFQHINGLTINGSGLIDGQGSIWWDCRAQEQCDNAPKALGIQRCTNVQLSNLNFKDSPKMHVVIDNTVGAHVTN